MEEKITISQFHPFYYQIQRTESSGAIVELSHLSVRKIDEHFILREKGFDPNNNYDYLCAIVCGVAHGFEEASKKLYFEAKKTAKRMAHGKDVEILENIFDHYDD